MREYLSPARPQLAGLAVHIMKFSDVKNYPSLADIADGFALQAGNMAEE
jgi:hypothetical protein